MAQFVRGGYFTVAEGILYPFMLDLFEAACAPLAITLNYAVLHAPVDVVQQRVQDRRGEPPHAGALADASVVDDLWTPVREPRRRRAAPGGLGPGHRPIEVAEEIDRRLEAGDFRL